MKIQYEMIIPFQKETFCRKLKETTYPLCMENEAYRDQILSGFSDDRIRLRASAGIMKGSGILFEGIVTEEAYGVRIVGAFRLLPRVKILSLLFLSVLTGAIFFIAGSSFALMLLLLPVVGLFLYLYQHLEAIFHTESGDERIFRYIREELHGMIVQKNLEEDI